MTRNQLSEHQIAKMISFLRRCPGVYVGSESNCVRFLSGVLWITRTGAQGSELPKRYGRWSSVYKRFARWREKGIWERLHADCAADPDLENLIIDSTVIRAHPCAAGAAQKSGGQAQQARDCVRPHPARLQEYQRRHSRAALPAGQKSGNRVGAALLL